MPMQVEQKKLYDYLFLITGNKSYKNCLRKCKQKNITKQVETKFTEYSVVENYLRRISGKNLDRVIPITMGSLNEYNLKTGSNIEEATIHYGPNSDEITRAYHANAVTIGNSIYFRNGAYKPETEEGRKTLAHELTHIQQNKEDILEGHRPTEELELEAEQTEKIAETIKAKKITKVINGKEYHLTPKQWKAIMDNSFHELERWVEMQKIQMSEEDYLELLLNFRTVATNYKITGEIKFN